MKKSTGGFTIVELIIAIVVIAILAAISIVSYTGIQNRAHDTAIQVHLRQMYQKFELEKFDGIGYSNYFGSGYDIQPENLDTLLPPDRTSLASGDNVLSATVSYRYFSDGCDQLTITLLSKSGNAFRYSCSGLEQTETGISTLQGQGCNFFESGYFPSTDSWEVTGYLC